ncbi:hypothetical protein BKA70DRAFT_1488233 [Coprinopsis sp. MPI-PUGE-AT-0042]|nr:hypothetical protein BKA70DRAFT_1488233 [Coprinopsis sp. MPI-PUGE-AT-0042]
MFVHPCLLLSHNVDPLSERRTNYGWSTTLGRRRPPRIAGWHAVYWTTFKGTRGEKQTIQNVEPVLASQLQLSRLSNYNITPRFVEAKQIHIYHATRKASRLDEYREYLILETDRSSILDAMEVVSAQHRSADCNHTSMNVVHNLAVECEDVFATMTRIALEDRDRSVTPENVSGFIINYHTYQEIVTYKGTTILKSIGARDIPAHAKLQLEELTREQFDILHWMRGQQLSPDVPLVLEILRSIPCHLHIDLDSVKAPPPPQGANDEDAKRIYTAITKVATIVELPHGV